MTIADHYPCSCGNAAADASDASKFMTYGIPPFSRSYLQHACMVTMATTSNLAATLSQAIDNASETTIRAVLKAMCQSSEECSKHAASYLLVPSTQQAPSLKRKTVIDPRTADQDEPADKKPKTAGDALEPRYEKCTTCKASFDVTTNTDTACKVHDGGVDLAPMPTL